MFRKDEKMSNRIEKFFSDDPGKQVSDKARKHADQWTERGLRMLDRLRDIPSGPRHESLWWYLSANLNEPRPLLIDVAGEVFGRTVDMELWMFGDDFECNYPGSKEALARLRGMPYGLYEMRVRFEFDFDAWAEEYPPWDEVVITRLVEGPVKVLHFPS